MPAATATRRATRRRTGEGDSDRLTALHDTLTEGVAALASGGQWAAMLAAARHFHRYSLSNLLLIYLTRPGATWVAGFHAWKRVGRSVRKGERGIPILAPCTYRTDTADHDGDRDDEPPQDGQPRCVLRGFKVVYVFDISQTDGEPIPDVAPVLLEGEDPGRLYDALALQVTAQGYTLHRAALPGESNGQTDYDARTVTVRADCSAAQACKTLAHELGHVLLHGLDDITGERRERAEVEAESIAFVVCIDAGDTLASPSAPTWP